MGHAYFSPYPKKSPDKVASEVIKRLGHEKAIAVLREMLLIRNFEVRAESAYQHGKIGGFFHAYSGEEAIATAAVHAFGPNNWYAATYRCHAMAFLLGASPNEVMAELYGRETGTAKGRGGSMHLYTERLLGGFAIVGGHLPIAAGAAFSLKYQGKKDEIAVCFLGEGAVAQGAFHEALNLAALWELPVVYIIENNQWGMGTHVSRAICSQPIAEKQAVGYDIASYTLDGMDYFHCFVAFEHIHKEVLEKGKPVLVECICERFRGHSISDPGFYRAKEDLEKAKRRDPIALLRHYLEEAGMIDEETFKALDKKQREKVIEAMQYAEKSPWPSPVTLEEEVYAP